MTLTAMPKYEAYKDSGVEWIGDIPKDWELTKLGTCLTPVSIKNRADLPLLSITRELGVIERDVEDQDSNHNFIPDDLSGYKVIESGQFGMNKMKAWQGSYGVSKHSGIVSPAYYIFKFKKDINPEFFHWAIRSHLYISFFASASDGVRIGQWDLSKDRMKEIPFVFPQSSIQIAIAKFLNEKTTQIDEAITIKERQIALLNERKQILIQQAVTQGLDPTVPMKDSGIEWIGKIPKHWSCPKLKLVCNFILDGTHGSYPRVDVGYRLLGVRNIVNDEFIFRDDDSKVSYRNFKEISTKFKVSEGDIQLAIVGATLGKVAVVKKLAEDVVTQRSLATLRVKHKLINSAFLASFLRSQSYNRYLWSNTSFSAQPGVYLNTIQNSYIALPPKDEQDLIDEHIKNETRGLNRAIDTAQLEIERLNEYKTTLINSAVTGKIKVV